MKNILITGGSSGIGLEIAESLIKSGGYRVISLSRSMEKVERAYSGKPHLKDKIDHIFADVSYESDCKNTYQYLEKNYHILHGLVNNAGILTKGGIETTSTADWDKTIATNLRGPFILTQALLPLLKKAPRASIVNISSIAAKKPGTSIAYSVSKAGLNMLTQYLAGDLGAYNINVNAIAPGLVRTNIHTDNNIFSENRDYEEMMKKSVSRYPIGRVGKPDDIAGLAHFLLSEKAEWISGAIFTIDGGVSVFNDLLPGKHE